VRRTKSSFTITRQITGDNLFNYHLVMRYVVGKLFSKVEHIELSALCVYFKGFIAKKLHRN